MAYAIIGIPDAISATSMSLTRPESAGPGGIAAWECRSAAAFAPRRRRPRAPNQ